MKIQATLEKELVRLFGLHGGSMDCSENETRRYAIYVELERIGLVTRSQITPEFPKFWRFTPVCRQG